jgi:uncharacterized membrane protein
MKTVQMTSQNERYVMLDFLRGLAVLLMIFYHSAVDLNGFRLIKIDLLGNPFWYGLPRFIVFLFLVCVGMALSIVHKNGIKWDLVRRRLYKIGGWAVAISLITYILFPKNFVFFGALHCIAVTSVVGVFLVNKPRLSLLLCLVLVIPDLIFRPVLLPISRLLDVTPFDYVPFYPWIGIVLLGIYFEYINFHKIRLQRNSIITALTTMGKHSLKIYLIHRPILLGMFFFLYKLKTSSG